MQQRPDFAPDTMFRIPKVTANLKLAMTEISGEKVGFVVFKKTKSSERLLEQEISFDIVAAPPPPEALAVLADLPLGQVVASSEAQRRAAFEALDRTRTGLQQGGGQNPNPQLANAIQIMTARDDASAEFSDSFRHVLVMPQEEYFVLIYVLPEDRRDEKFPEKGGSIILVPRDPAKGPEPTSFGINPDIADNKIRFAFRILAPLADRQAELLAHLERQ